MKKKPFYGWLVVALLFLISAGPMVWVSTFFGYYQTPVCEALGCSYVEFNLCSTASCVAGMLFSAFFAGKLAMGKTRYWVMVGGVVAGVCMYFMGEAQSIWVMVALFGVGNFAFNAVTYIPINVLIANWFVEKRAIATSIVMAGMGVGGMVFTPIASSLIGANWRNAYHITAFIVILVPLIVGWFLKKPDEMGKSPLMPREVPGESDSDEGTFTGWQGISKAEAFKTSSFYFYIIFCIGCGILAAGVAVQLPTFFIENGMDYTSRMTVYSFASLIGLIVMGTVIDKLGIKVGGVLTGLILVCSMICLILVPQMAILSFAAVILNPLGGCITSLGPPLLAVNTFGMRDYGGIYGLGQACFMGGCLVGPLLASSIRVATGSYFMAWIVFAAVACIMILSIITCVVGGAKLRKEAA